MKTLSKFSLLWISLIFISLSACKSDPVIIEVPGETTTIDTTGNGTIISVVESDICTNEVVSFQYEILPILVSNCAYSGCHDQASAEDGVILETYEKVRKEVKPGKPNDSELYESITENPNDEDFMPPRPADPLRAEQTALIRKWIEQGANNTSCRKPCNSEESSFTNDVFPIILENCYGCHQPNNAQGSINLEDYAHVVTFAANGLLLGSVKHTLGYSAMPPSGTQLTECQIATIHNWIVTGAKNN